MQFIYRQLGFKIEQVVSSLSLFFFLGGAMQAKRKLTTKRKLKVLNTRLWLRTAMRASSVIVPP